MDDVSRQLRACNTGCMIGNSIVNHIMYADDFVVFSPSSAGLQQLLTISSVYGVEHDIKYNAIKSVVMIFRTKDDKCFNYPDFKLANHKLSVCKKVKYLGHFITDKMTDDEDIYRQCRMMYA